MLAIFRIPHYTHAVHARRHGMARTKTNSKQSDEQTYEQTYLQPVDGISAGNIITT